MVICTKIICLFLNGIERVYGIENLEPNEMQCIFERVLQYRL